MGFDAPPIRTDRRSVPGQAFRGLFPGLLGAVVVAVALLLSAPVHAGSATPLVSASTSVLPSGLERRFLRLGTAEEWAVALQQLVRDELRLAEVPMPVFEVVDTDAYLGQFDARGWAVRFSSAALADVRTRTSNELAQLAGAARHEARHAEQWFRMAQLRASEGRSAAAIASEMSLPLPIATLAAAQPLPNGEMAAHAKRWWDSVYGSGNGHRNALLAGLMTATTAHEEATRVYRLHPSSESGAAMIQSVHALEPVFASYRALPEEADAFRAQEQFVTSLLRRDDPALEP